MTATADVTQVEDSPPAARKPAIALLAIPEVTASTLFGMYDLFAGVGRDWEMLVSGTPGEPQLQPCVVAARAEPFRAANGVWIRPDHTLADCPPVDFICISDALIAPESELRGRYDAEIAWLRECYAGGANLASACAGGLLLAEAGLLSGHDATMHWAYCDALAARHPDVRVHPDRAVVLTGEGQRIFMAGGGASWQDLALFMIARLLGTSVAMQTARANLIQWHQLGQQPFAGLARSAQAEDAVIARCQEWIAEHYDEDRCVAAMTERSGLPERSFKRRFARATGLSPLDYVHTLRIEEAKQLLESSELSIEAIAGEVGYEDAGFFSGLFKRKVGMTPAQYRRRFGALHRALQAVGRR
jgi:transcriptional regulator GlxA family with amidase domain